MQVEVWVLPCPACSAFIYLWTRGYIHGTSAAFLEGLFVHLNFSKSGDGRGETTDLRSGRLGAACPSAGCVAGRAEQVRGANGRTGR